MGELGLFHQDQRRKQIENLVGMVRRQSGKLAERRPLATTQPLQKRLRQLLDRIADNGKIGSGVGGAHAVLVTLTTLLIVLRDCWGCSPRRRSDCGVFLGRRPRGPGRG
jgi:hypothetical protein